MQHSFDVDIAVEYGILEAILLNNLWFWIKKNEANKVNYFDNDYWTYNSVRAFGELFPYVSQKQIQTALKHLENEGLIKTGNYNKSTYDRTLWYAFDTQGKSIMQKSKMEVPKKENGLVKNVEPIPDINTNINTNNKRKYIKEKYGTYGRVKLTTDEYLKLVNEFGEDFIKQQIELLDEYVESNNNKNKYTNFNLVLRKSIRENWFKKNNKKGGSSSFLDTMKEIYDEARNNN